MLKKILFILTLIPAFTFAQHSIKGKFSPAEDYEWVLLYKVTATHSNYIDDAKMNKDGVFEFELDSTYTQGMYRLVYAVPQEEFNFDIIYSGKENIEFTFNAETGVEYQSSVENKLMSSYTNSMAMVSQSIGNFYNQKSTDSLTLINIFETQKETQAEFEKISEGSIVSNFIKANRPYIPEAFEDINTYIKNLKIHFFDHSDFNNEVLQSSNFLVERTLNYVFGMTTQEGNEIETFKRNIDDVIAAMKMATLETKKMLLHILWQQLASANYEGVANYITDTSLLEIAKKLKDDELISELVTFKNVSLGQVAPDFDIEMLEDKKIITKKLSEYNVAEQYVLVFWSSGCSHCLEELPQLHEFIKTFETDKLKVIAFGIEEDEFRWKAETYNFPDFTHVIGLGKWKNKTGNAYNISSTPTYFVLGKDKKILAKLVDINELKTFLSN